MLERAWRLIRDTAYGYVEDGAMSRGAAIAFYTVFSIAPLLVIAIAIAGFAFGQQAVEGAVAAQLRGLLGDQAAEAVQAMVRGASNRESGTIATLISLGTLFFTASGVFGELQSALNVIWRAEPPESSIGALLRAKLLSIGLVAATGFLLLVSLLASTALAAFATWVGGILTDTQRLLAAANFLLSLLFTTALFAAIYKVLPDRVLRWRDVLLGALVTALLFTIGKSLIGWYLGASSIASSYGAAGSLMVFLLWVYYSAQIFLLGAEFTRAWAGFHAPPVVVPRVEDAERPTRAARPPPPPRPGAAWRLAAVAALLVTVFRRGR